MAGFVEGVDREQSTLIPALLDYYIADDNPVRAVDAFVDGLDLRKLVFANVQALDIGRPGIIPQPYSRYTSIANLNRIPSSRRPRMRVSAQHRADLADRRLAPDFKTIADFRKDKGRANAELCRAFVVLWRKLNLLSEASVAIDGSKFKAFNGARQHFHRKQDGCAVSNASTRALPLLGAARNPLIAMALLCRRRRSRD